MFHDLLRMIVRRWRSDQGDGFRNYDSGPEVSSNPGHAVDISISIVQLVLWQQTTCFVGCVPRTDL